MYIFFFLNIKKIKIICYKINYLGLVDYLQYILIFYYILSYYYINNIYNVFFFLIIYIKLTIWGWMI